MGIQEIGMIAAGVIVLGAIVWVANKVNNKNSATPKQ